MSERCGAEEKHAVLEEIEVVELALAISARQLTLEARRQREAFGRGFGVTVRVGGRSPTAADPNQDTSDEGEAAKTNP